MRADLFLVQHGHAATRSQAQRLIAAGVQWRLEADKPWKKVSKNGDEIPDAAELQVLDTAEAQYISRGGLKLAGALHSTGLNVHGLRCLDIGQSTGGFTDCLLQQGARQVVGIDVGHGQLHPSLRADTRVLCIEGVNARTLSATDLIAESAGIESTTDPFDAELFDVLTADVSFISLTLVLPAVTRLLKPGGAALLLVKPQFELQPGQVGKGGIVRDAAHFSFVEERLRQACAALGLQLKAWFDSPIAGGDGNREFFIHAVNSADGALDPQPLPAAPLRKTPKRQPRPQRQDRHEPHEDPQSAHDGQPGPARSKRRAKPTDS